MSRTPDELSNSISTMIMHGISNPYSEAILEVELHALAMKICGGYLQEETGEACAFKFIKEHRNILMNDLIELNLMTSRDDESRWNTMNYNLKKSGEYKIDYAWDQELADNIEKVREA